MAQQHFPANQAIEMILIALQLFQVLFLWVHDWIPLGPLNDVRAVQSQDTRRRLVTVTLIQSLPWTIGLYFSLLHLRRPNPDLALQLARDQLWPALHRANPRLVDTLSFPTGTRASCSLSNHVRQSAFLLTAAQWNGPKHCAYPASSGHRGHVDRSPREVKTAEKGSVEDPDLNLYYGRFGYLSQLPSYSE